MSTELVSTRNTLPALTGGTLESYIQAARSVPMLSPEEEYALAEDLQQTGNIDSAQKLVLPHLRFVIKIANNYNGYGLPIADLIQEGSIGLMKAVKRFRPEVGVRLVSFAVHWIRAEIHEFVLRNWRIVKVATTKAQRKLFFNLRKSKKSLAWLSAAETEAVAKDLGVSVKEVTEMEKRLSARDALFDPAPDNDEERVFSPAAYLPAPDSDPAKLVEDFDWESDATARMTAAIETLDERSRDIVQSRWLTEKKKTLHQLAEVYGVSAERIRQIEVNAIKKLRGAMAH